MEELEWLISRECSAHHQWKTQLGECFKFANIEARWGDAHERNQDVMGKFSAIESFLREFKNYEDLPSHAARRLVVSVPYAAVTPRPLVKTEVQPLNHRAFPLIV